MLRLLRLNSHMGSERVLTIQLDNQTQTTTTTSTTASTTIIVIVNKLKVKAGANGIITRLFP